MFRTIDDFYRLDSLTSGSGGGSRRIAVIGGGFLGSELACALANRAAKVERKTGGKSKLEIVQIFPEEGCMGKV